MKKFINNEKFSIFIQGFALAFSICALINSFMR